MATKAAALQAWLEGFGLPVYRDSAVPGEAKMPYITYDLPTARPRPRPTPRPRRSPGRWGCRACCCRATAAACG